MVRVIDRGEVVLAPDPYSGKSGRRPFVIVSNEEYPFYPSGYLGCPITSKDRPNTYQLHKYDMEYVNEELHIQPSYVNPYSPHQVNDAGRTLVKMSDKFIDLVTETVGKAMGLGE
jgi:hypothetical protein